MDRSEKSVETSMQVIGAYIEATVGAGGTYALPHPKGKSMYPVINPATDTVLLAAPTNIELFDAILFRRKNGAYVLHRVIGQKKGAYTVCGDNQILPETVSPEHIVAKLVGIKRQKDGKEIVIDINDASYRKNIRRLHRKKLPKRLYYRLRHIIASAIRALPGCKEFGRKKS